MITKSAAKSLTALCLLLLPAPLTARGDSTYRLLKEIPVGGEGGWDCLSVDAAGRRLYVSHATKAVVIDIDKDEVVGEVTDTPGIHAIAVAPELHRGFTSNGREAKASIFDLDSLATSSKVDTGQNPDFLLYVPQQKEVYVFNGRGKSATVIDAESGKVVTTIELPGKPEFAVYDPAAGRVYDNIEDKSEVAAIDTKTHAVADTWPTGPGEEPSGMALDTTHHRLFLGCGNKLMVMMDSASGKVLANVPIGQGVDSNAFDPATQLAFSSNGEGNVTIAHEDAPDSFTVVQTLETERGARTMTLDPQTHKIYLPSAKFEAPQPGQRRPNIVPDSFKVLVYGLE
jgi:DNA-binding beta-propeller fold protein YncE